MWPAPGRQHRRLRQGQPRPPEDTVARILRVGDGTWNAWPPEVAAGDFQSWGARLEFDQGLSGARPEATSPLGAQLARGKVCCREAASGAQTRLGRVQDASGQPGERQVGQRAAAAVLAREVLAGRRGVAVASGRVVLLLL